MSKNLPSVFANKINNVIDNVQSVFYGNKNNNIDINSVLDNIFDSGSYIFNTSLEIITKSGQSIERLALRTKDYLLTLNNKKINIKDIISIRPIK